MWILQDVVWLNSWRTKSIPAGPLALRQWTAWSPLAVASESSSLEIDRQERQPSPLTPSWIRRRPHETTGMLRNVIRIQVNVFETMIWRFNDIQCVWGGSYLYHLVSTCIIAIHLLYFRDVVCHLTYDPDDSGCPLRPSVAPWHCRGHQRIPWQDCALVLHLRSCRQGTAGKMTSGCV